MFNLLIPVRKRTELSDYPVIIEIDSIDFQRELLSLSLVLKYFIMRTFFPSIWFFLIISLLTACNSGSDKNKTITVPTEEEQIQAVKDLLKQSVNEAIADLTKQGVFSNSDSLKIKFPKELQFIVENAKKIPQGSKLLENTFQQLDSVTENSLKIIKPVINAAIDSMSVEEANKILLAKNEAAATEYLIKILKEPLLIACRPIVIQSLDKQIMNDITPRNSWSVLANNYNKFAKSKIGEIANVNPLEEEILDEFVTESILDAVFYLVAREEKKIRKHPGTKISQSVVEHFGWLDKNNKE